MSLESKLHAYALGLPNQMMGQADLIKHFPQVALDAITAALNKLSKKNLVQTMDLGPAKGIKWKAVSKNEAKKLATLDDDEGMVYKVIEAAGNEGIWTKFIKTQTNLHQTIINKVLKALESKNEVKSVKSVKYPTRKLYMLYNLTPSVELTGGPWFTDNELDTEFIRQLLSAVLTFIQGRSYPRQKGMTNVLFPVSHTSAYPTAPQIATWIKKANITPTELDVGHINTLLAVLEYDGEIQALPASSSYDDSRGGGSVSSSKVVNVASKRKKKGESDSDDSDAEREKEEKRAKKRKEEKRRKQEKERKKLEAKKRKKKEERRRKKKKKGGSSDDESDSGSGSDSESETGSDSDDNSDSSDVKSSRSRSRSKSVSSKPSKRSSSSKSKSKKKRSSISSDSGSDNSDSDAGSSSSSSSSPKSQKRSSSKSSLKSKSKSSRSKPKDGSDSDDDSMDDSALTSKSKRKLKRVEVALSDDDKSGSGSEEERKKKKRQDKKGKSRAVEEEEEEDDGRDIMDFGEEDEGFALVYRAIKPEKVSLGWTEAPCGRCPLFTFCKEGGPVEPDGCQYYSKWLDAPYGDI